MQWGSEMPAVLERRRSVCLEGRGVPAVVCVAVSPRRGGGGLSSASVFSDHAAGLPLRAVVFGGSWLDLWALVCGGPPLLTGRVGTGGLGGLGAVFLACATGEMGNNLDRGHG